jgi:hypothetical protein
MAAARLSREPTGAIISKSRLESVLSKEDDSLSTLLLDLKGYFCKDSKFYLNLHNLGCASE